MTAPEDNALQDLDAEQKNKVKEILEKDSASGRSPSGLWKWIVALLGGGMVIFYFYTAGLASVATQYHRGVYVLVTYVLVFLLYPTGSRWLKYVLAILLGALVAGFLDALLFYPDTITFHTRLLEIGAAWSASGAGAGIASLMGMPVLVAGTLGIAAVVLLTDRWMEARWPQNPVLSDVLFALISASLVYYWIHEFEALNYRAGAETELDALVSVAGILISLEVCRRVLGWSMTIIGVLMICYAYFGPYMPETIAHRGFGIERLATALYLTTNGVFGVMANVLATYVILFIFFGAFLHKSGAGRFFIDLPMAAAGHSTGGPAKVAVVASALFGSVSGSAIANTVSTGAFTIPLMKRAGFR
ncbi:MAG: TRAP transporter large permease subunit, partial [Chromatiales bacterium]|nr:TRAP transporter large permease subunit [Chromatiales bacterium]